MKKAEEYLETEVLPEKAPKKGDIYEQRLEMINKLLNPIQTPLNIIREEDEDKDEVEITEDERKNMLSKKLFFDVTRSNKLQDQKELM